MATAKTPLSSAGFEFSGRSGRFCRRWFDEKGTVAVIAR
jgi:hypothetical protein